MPRESIRFYKKEVPDPENKDATVEKWHQVNSYYYADTQTADRSVHRELTDEEAETLGLIEDDELPVDPPGHPEHLPGKPGRPARPDEKPDQGLPGKPGRPAKPDQGLPGDEERPDQGLPDEPGLERPDNELPEGAEPRRKKGR